MAKLLAGTLLIFLGAGAVFIGWQEWTFPVALSTYGSLTTLTLGILMMLAGILHFRAPHKSFLLSLALLLVFQIHLYSLALFYDVENLFVFLGGFLIASILILLLSYRSYQASIEEDSSGDS